MTQAVETADSMGPGRLDSRDVVRREWALADLLAVFARRRVFVLVCVLAALVLGAAYCLTATRRYLATGQIEINPRPAGTLGLDASVTGGGANNSSSALSTTMAMETDARILRSGALALVVIKELRLETTSDYFAPGRGGVWFPAWLRLRHGNLEPLSVPIEEAPNRRAAALKIFASHLKVTPVSGTRLIDVSYASPDPKLAARVVNRLIAALQEYTFESRFQATSQASTWLAGQLAGLKKQTENLEQTANGMEQGTGVYGGDAAHNLVLARLDQLNLALQRAESDRILRQSIYEVVRSGDPEMISGLAGNAAFGSSPAMNNSLALLQTLRAEQAKVQATIDEDNARYGGAFPKMAELHGQLRGLNGAIQAEIGRIGERAKTDYEVAQKSEDAARAALEKQEQLATADNGPVTAYEMARQDADSSRRLYQGLLDKLKEAGVLEGLRSSDLTVVSAALEPPTNRPHSPDVPLILAAALVAGLFVGCAGALAREAMDHSVRSVEDLELALGVPLAGMVARRGGGWRLGCSLRRKGVSAIRGAELQAPFALARRGARPKTVLITSPAVGEGKSRLAVTLAASLAHGGAQVLLVDADLRRSSLHTLLADEDGAEPEDARGGLSEALRSGAAVAARACAEAPGLWLIPAGQVANSANAACAAALLDSPRMEALMAEWRGRYDVVLVDSAPALAAPDAAALARLCDRVVLVVRYERTAMRAAERGYRMMRRNLAEHAELDVVMNGVPRNSADYVAYYGQKGARA